MTDAQKKKVSNAVRQVLKMGTWDSIHVDIQEGEPIIFAAIHRHPVHKFLLDTGVMKKPQLPAQVEGVRCEVRVHYPAKKARK